MMKKEQKEKQMSSKSILQYFEQGCRPEDHIRYVSNKLQATALLMDEHLPECADKSAGLRKLLEARKFFARAALLKGIGETDEQ
jgi:hypothetical protein